MRTTLKVTTSETITVEQRREITTIELARVRTPTELESLTLTLQEENLDDLIDALSACRAARKRRKVGGA